MILQPDNRTYSLRIKETLKKFHVTIAYMIKKKTLKKLTWWLIAIAVIGGMVIVPILQVISML